MTAEITITIPGAVSIRVAVSRMSNLHARTLAPDTMSDYLVETIDRPDDRRLSATLRHRYGDGFIELAAAALAELARAAR